MAWLLSLEYGPALPLRLPNHLDKSVHITVSTPHVINRQRYGEGSCSHSSDCDDGVSNEQSYLINHCCLLACGRRREPFGRCLLHIAIPLVRHCAELLLRRL